MVLRWQVALFAGIALLRARMVAMGRRSSAAREGQSFLEYALVLAVIAVIVLVAAQAFGVDLAAVFERIRNRLGSLG
jgi:Flp pilus assembly pilin Flp